jgi:uncharacterized protein YjlB
MVASLAAAKLKMSNSSSSGTQFVGLFVQKSGSMVTLPDPKGSYMEVRAESAVVLAASNSGCLIKSSADFSVLNLIGSNMFW